MIERGIRKHSPSPSSSAPTILTEPSLLLRFLPNHEASTRLLALLSFFVLVGSLAAANPRISRGMIAEKSGFQLQVIADGLFLPWAVAWLLDGSALITEKRGTLRFLREGSLSEPLDFPVPVTSGGESGITRGQGGLMDVPVDPDFENNGWLYFTYSTGDPSADRTELPDAIHPRVVWLDTHAPSGLYVLTDSESGQLLRIPPPPNPSFSPEWILNGNPIPTYQNIPADS